MQTLEQLTKYSMNLSLLNDNSQEFINLKNKLIDEGNTIHQIKYSLLENDEWIDAIIVFNTNYDFDEVYENVTNAFPPGVYSDIPSKPKSKIHNTRTILFKSGLN